MAYNLEQIDAKIAELEAALGEAVTLPDSGNIGGSSYSGLRGMASEVRGELDRWRRIRETYLNGGIAMRTRRGCG